MKFFKFLSLVAVIAALSMTSCKEGGDSTAAAPASVTPTSTTTPTPSADPASTVPVGPLTSLVFTNTEHDFGEITEGDKVTYMFKFKNTGDEPLVISKAQGSCGCTVPDWPREPIPVGGEGEIKVQYDSRGKGQPEGRAENKRVTITANTDPVNSYLYIKGKVFKPAGEVAS
ncbi:MAG: DUF1573 domain-containing protein [Saprospiraceae bacterium]